MILELADGPRKKKKVHRRTIIKDGEVWARINAYERRTQVPAHWRRTRAGLNSGDNHIYVPKHLFDGVNNVWVREDKFDGLSESEWEITMDELLNYQPGMSDLSGKARRAAKKEAKAEKKAKRAARKEEKKAIKSQKKIDKNQRKNERSESKAYRRRGKGDAAVIRAQAKQDKANRPRITGGRDGEGSDSDYEDTSTGRGIFSNIISKGKDLINKFKGAPAPEGGEEPEGSEAPEGDGSGGSDSDAFQIAGMNIPKPVAYVGSALLIGGILYAATRKKK